MGTIAKNKKPTMCWVGMKEQCVGQVVPLKGPSSLWPGWRSGGRLSQSAARDACSGGSDACRGRWPANPDTREELTSPMPYLCIIAASLGQ